MKAIAALKEGGRQSMRLFRLTVLFYLANLAMAALVAAPLAVLISRDLSRSLEGARIFANLDAAWIAEFAFNHRGVPATDTAVLGLAAGFAFLLLNTFLAGGAIALYRREDDAFFSACARYFPRLFRLLLISAFFYGVVIALAGTGGRLSGRLAENSMEARPWVILSWVRAAVALFLAGGVNMVFDYAKIACITGEMRSAWRASMAGLRFVATNIGRTLAIYWICGAVAIAMLIAYHGLSEFASQETMPRVILVLALRQAYVLFRMWVRQWTWSSELHAFWVAPAEPVPVPPPADVSEEPPVPDTAFDQEFVDPT